MLLQRFTEVAPILDMSDAIDERRRMLIGADFTQEYGFEAAALFNPSAVPHTDQRGVPGGAVRFLLSLRAIGDGHVSSLSFRTGLWAPSGALTIDAADATTQGPQIERDANSDPGIVRLHCGGSRVVSETVLFSMTPQQKGMALFPRRVAGRYAMLGRHDNENIWLLLSDALPQWTGGIRVVEPRYSWEHVQMGSCGPLIELDEGWLV